MNSFPYPSMRDRFDLRFYFVVGPDDCGNRPILDVVAKALDGGASFIQLRAKTQDVAEIVSLANDIAEEIAGHHVEHSVAFVVDDRVDAALEARAKGIKVDGVHIGQDDLDPVVARKLLGPDAIIGLSAKTVDEVREANHLPEGTIDYIGAGPLHMTATKPESMIVDENGDITTLNVSSIDEMRTMSKYPLIVGGGVGAAPLFMFTEQLVREGREVEVVLGAQTASMMVTRGDYASLLGRDPIVATDDGSLGYAGFCTEPVREELARGGYSAVYCCGPTPLMRAVAAIAEEAGVPCWVSMEKRMACGVGACLSCVVETQAGKRRSCVDGPVFNAKELVW